MRTCPNCGEENPEKFRLCGFCGTPFATAPPPKEVRKTVTVVFSDLKGSTNLGEALDSESLREVMSRYFDEMRGALEAHGGTVEKFIGDAVMAVFGLPRLHEDDALRAVRAACAMKAALVELNDELEERYGVRLANRTGVNTGEVVAGDPSAGQRLVTGDTVNVAARLEQAAPADEILLGELTWRLVRDAVDAEPVEPLELKGKSQRVPAFRLVEVHPESRRERPAPGPVVGRDAELAVVAAAFAEAVETGGCRTVTVVGQAGLGKTRLLAEAAARVPDGATVLRGRCLSYGGTTFWPLLEVVQQAAGVAEDATPAEARGRLETLLGPAAADVAERVASAVGLSSAEFPLEELFWGARKLLEQLAEAGPVVVVWEDVHWAEPTFLDLVEHLGSSAAGPLLVLCGARPELLEQRGEWAQGPGARRVVLEPLGPGEAGRVVEHLLGGGLDEEVRERIVAASDGNPLFVEQLVSMLVDEGRLRHEDGAWRATADLAELRAPPTINALVAARLDRLSPGERAVIDAATVMGVTFYPSAVRDLSPEGVRAEVPAHLAALTRKQLVAPGEPDAIAAGTYRFEHALVREVAYGALLKRDRAALHERFVDWLHAAGTRPEEIEEILAYHLEQAHRYLGELGPLDEHGRALGARGAALLAGAGRRAFAREDMPAAAGLLGRAAALLPRADPARLELLPPLGEALMDMGDFAVAQGHLDEALALAATAGERRLEALATLILLLLRGQAGGPEDWSEDVALQAQATLPALVAAGDEAGQATAWRVMAWTHGTACRFGAAAEAAERAIEHATRAGDDRQRRRASVQYAVAATYGPTPVLAAIPRCEQILGQARGDRRTEGLVMNLLARLEAMRGAFERARELYRAARATLQEMGPGVVASSTSLDSCGVEVLAGDLEAAERELRRDYEALTQMGEKYLLSTVAAELARVLCEQGRDDEAGRFARVAEELTAADDVVSQAIWRSVRGRLLARAGEDPDEAVAFAGRAVGLLAETDARETQAEALLDLAEVEQRVGRPEDAALHTREALLMLEAKGVTAGARRASAHAPVA